MRLLLFFAFLLLGGCATTGNYTIPATAPAHSWKVTCGTIPGHQEWSYCMYLSPTATKTGVWMHGLEDAPTIFQGTKNPLPNSYAEFVQAMPDMNWFIPSLGPGWLLTGYPGRKDVPVSATVEQFMQVVMPFMESTWPVKGPYVLAGHSQGGFNVAKLCPIKLADNKSPWSKCAMINPMVIPDNQDPFKLSQVCWGCLMIKGGTVNILGWKSVLFTGNYDTKDQWLADRPEPMPDQPPMWVTACPTDFFGLYPGGQEYALKARAVFVRGKNSCSHFIWDAPASIDFITRT